MSAGKNRIIQVPYAYPRAIMVWGLPYDAGTKFEKIGEHKVAITQTNSMGSSKSWHMNIDSVFQNQGFGMKTADSFLDEVKRQGGVEESDLVQAYIDDDELAELALASKTSPDDREPAEREVDDDGFNPFTGKKNKQVPENPDIIKELIKKVFCPYNYNLVVYDVHNQRVAELCGRLNKDKFYELMRRCDENTVFDGLANFKCAACELGAISRSGDLDDNIAPLHIVMDKVKADDQKNFAQNGPTIDDSFGDPIPEQQVFQNAIGSLKAPRSVPNNAPSILFGTACNSAAILLSTANKKNKGRPVKQNPFPQQIGNPSNSSFGIPPSLDVFWNGSGDLGPDDNE